MQSKTVLQGQLEEVENTHKITVLKAENEKKELVAEKGELMAKIQTLEDEKESILKRNDAGWAMFLFLNRLFQVVFSGV